MSDKPRTVLGFDYGEKRIGVAVGQSVTGSARALVTLNSKTGQPDWQAIASLIQEWQPDALVVGLPMHMDGQHHEITEAAQRFGNRLRGRYNLPVVMVDERLTSHEAEQQFREEHGRRPRPEEIDSLAAQIIVQDWLSQNE